MSKERARRREQREKEKAARARKNARRQKRRALVRSLTGVVPQRRGTGRLYRRSRAQRIGMVVVPVLAAALIWLLVPDLSLRIVLTAVIVLILPVAVVVTTGRRT